METDAHKTALAQASLMLLAAWQAAAVEGSEKAPEVLASLEQMIQRGEVTFVVSVARSASTVQLKAHVYDAGDEGTPELGQPVLAITGPLVLSPEDFAKLAVAVVGTVPPRDSLN